MKKIPLPVFTIWLALLSFTAAAAPPPILPFSEVKPGMKGIGKTAFEGSAVGSFQVEILGKLTKIGPDQNLILGRLSGGPLAQTGVMAGMSGSPVFVDGKLIGAVAYSWGFSKEPIAGITPIEEMLAVGARDESVAKRPRAAGLTASDLERLKHPASNAGFVEALFDRLTLRFQDDARAVTPLAVSGLGAEGLSSIETSLRRTGLRPLQAGGAATSASAAPPLEPGSPVGIKLVRGDIDMTATGTVTWVDGNKVLAFGHPLFGLGAVDLPLTAARVEALLPSLDQSAKIASPLEELGAFRQDRPTAIAGRLGARPRMIPVRLQLTGLGGERKTYAFDLADDPLLAPVFLYLSLNGILQASERTYGSISLRLREGSIVKLDGVDGVELDNLFAGPTALDFATGLPAFILYLLLNNDWAVPQVTGVNLILDYDDKPRTAQIRRVTLDRYRVRSGETIQATIVLAPFRGEEIAITQEIAVPEETAPGRLTLHVGDAMAVTRADQANDGIRPRDLGQLVRLINHLRRNDRVYILASREDSGAFLAGARLPNLPPSTASILSRPRSLGNVALVPQRGILEEEIPTDFAVEGLARVQVEVEAP